MGRDGEYERIDDEEQMREVWETATDSLSLYCFSKQ